MLARFSTTAEARRLGIEAVLQAATSMMASRSSVSFGRLYGTCSKKMLCNKVVGQHSKMLSCRLAQHTDGSAINLMLLEPCHRHDRAQRQRRMVRRECPVRLAVVTLLLHRRSMCCTEEPLQLALLRLLLCTRGRSARFILRETERGSGEEKKTNNFLSERSQDSGMHLFLISA